MANHVGDSDWRQLLPYAHRYLQKTWFSGSEDDIVAPLRWYIPARGLPPGVRLSQDQCVIHTNSLEMPSTEKCFVRVGWYDTVLQVHYWEIKICGGRNLGEFPVAVGYDDIIHYSSDGTISSLEELRLLTDSFVSDRDVVGCGFVHPRTFFFTKNGHHLGDFEVYDARKWNCLKPRVSMGPGTPQSFEIRTNFGKEPFVFDKMAELCAERYHRSVCIAARIPMEILERILLEALKRLIESLDYNYIDIARYGRRSLDRLSLVCRRWNAISSIVRSRYLTIKSSGEFQQALTLPSLTQLRVLLTNENEQDPYIHRLLVSPLPTMLTSLTKWTCDPQEIQFLDHLPPRISRAVPGLLRNNFSNVRSLRLDSQTFSQWSYFCRIVYAFPHLEDVVIYQVEWSDLARIRNPSAMPPYYQRLRELQNADTFAFLSRGHLWLFIAGRPSRSEGASRPPSRDLLLSAEDTPIIAEAMSLMVDICPLARVTYDSPDNQQCTLSLWLNSRMTSARAAMSLSFERGGEGYYCLKRILLAFESQDIDIEKSAKRVDSFLDRLSNADTCICCVNLTGRKRGLGNPHLTKQQTTKEIHDLLCLLWTTIAGRRTAGLLEFAYDDEIFRVPEDMGDRSSVFVIVAPNARTMWTVGQLCRIKWISPVFDDNGCLRYFQMRHATNKTVVVDLTLEGNLHSKNAQVLVPYVYPGTYYVTVEVQGVVCCSESFRVEAKGAPK